jgi:phenylacetate-CoA ligase
MNVQLTLKSFLEKLPPGISRWLAHIPFSVRFGRPYTAASTMIRTVENMTLEEYRLWSFLKIRATIDHAYETNEFYRSFYSRHRFSPHMLRSIDHLQDVPIVRKRDLQEFEIDARSTLSRGRMRINTGGTRGEPLYFFVDRDAFAREWAHMHYIWGIHGYRYRDLKLTFRGRNLGHAPMRFNAVHNEIIVNTYADRQIVAAALSNLDDTNVIRWIHGYPSAVADWMRWLHDFSTPAFERITKDLQGVLLGSEFPTPNYRATISSLLGTPIIAWYGHSEMSVLAYETAPNIYKPLRSYGFAEAVPTEGSEQNLVATSFWNTTSPFIRYDTGDGIAGHTQSNVLESFSITNGRVGEFVINKLGEKLSLTAIIFGRHHPGFEHARHLQVVQHNPGTMELIVVPIQPSRSSIELAKLFDFSYCNLDVTIRVLDDPIRTSSGKIKLLLSPNDLIPQP